MPTIVWLIRRALVLGLAGILAFAGEAGAVPSRIKDIADFEGVRDNMLVGYDIVVGLNGTGDSQRNSAFTAQSLTSMLERLGVATRSRTSRARGRVRSGSARARQDRAPQPGLHYGAAPRGGDQRPAARAGGGARGRCDHHPRRAAGVARPGRQPPHSRRGS